MGLGSSRTGSPGPTMQLFVRDLAGRSVPLSVDPCSSVEVLKLQVTASCGVPEDEQSLTFGGRVLDSSELLGKIGLTDESTVFLNLELEGGGKKRKKKTYTKPKKSSPRGRRSSLLC